MDYGVYLGEDLYKLKEIWKTCFADTDEFLDAFFRGVYKKGCAVVAQEQGEICSAMYVLDAGTIATDNSELLRCCYLYALGTLPEFRGKGIGADVTGGAIELGFMQGYDICITCPAQESLFDYYRHLGFEDFSWASRIDKKPDTVALTSNGRVMSTDLEEYLKLRESHLPSHAVTYSEGYMRFLDRLLTMSGGGVYTLELAYGTGIAAAAPDGNDGVLLKELICNEEDACDALRLMAGHFKAGRVSALCPPTVGGGSYVNTLAIFSPAKKIDNKAHIYFPFMLD